MPISDLTTYAQLGGTVVTVVLFLSYLEKKDKESIEATNRVASSNIKLAIELQRLSDVVGTNTSAVKENKPTVDKNTDAVGENTEAIVKNNGN